MNNRIKKQIQITELYEEVIPKILESESTWKDFLTFSANHYIMGFESVSLVYAQRPDAELLETYEGWQGRGRQVKRGSTGIAFVNEGYRSTYIDYVFDIKDTYGNTVPDNWEISKAMEQDMLALLDTKSQSIKEYITEDVQTVAYDKSNHYLEQLGDLFYFKKAGVNNAEPIFAITEAAIKSAAYMAASRCKEDLIPMTTPLPPLPFDIKSLVYGFCITTLNIAGDVLLKLEMAASVAKDMKKGFSYEKAVEQYKQGWHLLPGHSYAGRKAAINKRKIHLTDPEREIYQQLSLFTNGRTAISDPVPAR